MKKIKDFIDALSKRLFSSTYQIQRIVALTGIALALTLVSFGGYYYYDRYYTSQPKTADAILEQAEKAVREKPDDPDARLNLAETYMVNNRFDDAIETANQVMQAYPNNQRAWFVFGVASALGGKPAQAIDPLEKFLDANKAVEMPGLNKTLQSAAYYLGDSYLRLNQPDKAVHPLEQAVDWSQTDADAMYKLGMAYVGVKRNEEAIAMFQGATRFVPNYTEAYEGMTAAFVGLNEPVYADYARGMVAYSKKDYKTALTLLQTASNTIKDFPPIYDGLGLNYESLGDLQNAKASYETSIKLDPNDFTASTGLQRVDALLKK